MSDTEQTTQPENSAPEASTPTEFGGRWLPEAYRPLLDEVDQGLRRVAMKRGFRRKLRAELESFGGRPTPLLTADRLSAQIGGAKILLKREDRNETGSRHLTAAMGQALLAEQQGRRRLLVASSSGAGAVAVAAAGVRFGLDVSVYAGVEDLRVREGAFSRAETLGAEIVPVDHGFGSVAEALQVAFADWHADPRARRLVLTSPVGPSPFPELVAEFEAILGSELASQLRKRRGKRSPDLVVGPLLGGATVGLFDPFVERVGVRLIAVGGVPEEGWEHELEERIVQGARTLALGALQEDHPTPGSAGPGRPDRYAALAPELAQWVDSGRVGVAWASDRSARAACRTLAEAEGLLVSLQSGEVIAEACERASRLSVQDLVVAILPGRGDDDIGALAAPLPAHSAVGPVRDYPLDSGTWEGGE